MHVHALVDAGINDEDCCGVDTRGCAPTVAVAASAEALPKLELRPRTAEATAGPPCMTTGGGGGCSRAARYFARSLSASSSSAPAVLFSSRVSQIPKSTCTRGYDVVIPMWVPLCVSDDERKFIVASGCAGCGSSDGGGASSLRKAVAGTKRRPGRLLLACAVAAGDDEGCVCGGMISEIRGWCCCCCCAIIALTLKKKR